VEEIRYVFVLENRVLSSKALTAEGRSAVPVSAQNLATVERPAAEFLELRKQRRSVARIVFKCNHKSGIPARRQKAIRFRE
jgi:hypothetical protein